MMTLIAHRGASKEAPENTLVAMKRALEIGVDYIECDVHLSRDGVPIVIHDALLGRTTDQRRLERVIDLDLSHIRELDAGGWFGSAFAAQRVPTLEEVLQLDRGTTGLMIEIKKSHSRIKSIVSGVINCLQTARQDRVLLGSFSPAILESIRQEMPAQPLIGIVEDFNMLKTLQSLHLSHMALWHKLINPQLVKNLHEEGKVVWAFTVDEPRVVTFLKSIGVDGIITNDPRSIKSLV